MLSLQEIKEFRQRFNKFGNLLGVTIEEMKEGYARCALPIRDEFYNPNSAIHGGVIFSLADTSSGAAASSHGYRMTTMDATLSYLAPAMGTEYLYGEAKEIKKGKTICVYDVWITDDEKKLIAKGTYTFYNLGKPILLSDENNGGHYGIKDSIITDHDISSSSSASRQV